MSRRRSLSYAPPAEGSRLFVADWQGGISYSDDGGATVNRVSVSSVLTRLWRVVKSANGTVAACGDTAGTAGTPVVFSTDNGETYSRAPSSGQGINAKGLATDGAGGWLVPAASNSVVYVYSTDDFANCTAVTNLSNGARDKLGAAYGDGLWMMCGANGYYWTSASLTGAFTSRKIDGQIDLWHNCKYVNGLWWLLGSGKVAYSATGVGDWTVVNTGVGIAFDLVWQEDSGRYYMVGAGAFTGYIAADAMTTYVAVANAGATYKRYGLCLNGDGTMTSTATDSATLSDGFIQVSSPAFWSLKSSQTDYGYTGICCG